MKLNEVFGILANAENRLSFAQRYENAKQAWRDGYHGKVEAGGPGSGCNPDKGKCGRPSSGNAPSHEMAKDDRRNQRDAEDDEAKRFNERKVNGPRDWRKEYDDKVKATKKEGMQVAKGLVLPGGKGAKWDNTGFTWSKRGGYANSQMDRLFKSAEKAGFVKETSDSHGSPDGNYMGTSVIYRKGDWVLREHHTYGVVAYDNSFHISLQKETKPAPTPVVSEYTTKTKRTLGGKVK